MGAWVVLRGVSVWGVWGYVCVGGYGGMCVGGVWGYVCVGDMGVCVWSMGVWGYVCGDMGICVWGYGGMGMYWGGSQGGAGLGGLIPPIAHVAPGTVPPLPDPPDNREQ